MTEHDALSYKGTFREEVLWLRCIFGLDNISSSETTLLPQRLLALPTILESTIKDVILIAIDVEAKLSNQGKQLDLSKNFQVGLSILDTRLLPSILSTSTTEDGYQDLLFLKNIGLDLLPICILDIQKVSQTVLQVTRRQSLEQLVTILGCPFKYLHIGGNDANFTLRALLMLVVKDSEYNLTGLRKLLLSVLQEIAQSTMLNSTTWLDKPDEEDWKRLQESKFTTTEQERQEKNKEKSARKLAKKRWKKST
ncbi:hypothetical protein BP6252_08577 [Coleophoma cylindrospora]|uniref:Gfd2/YDR514C-like C-terminal domain-containing protein n=1 Tax=Coleophoma cylindrospora TaxID=1849047 RepID=A0A3D8R6D0_9HELO|nr:hypothetical protein BP6252_08577 [Coleophoma cylindrospora]